VQAPGAGTRWIDGTANVAGAGVELAGEVANHQADAFHVVQVGRGAEGGKIASGGERIERQLQTLLGSSVRAAHHP